jgi:hypothetical protein
MVTDLSDLSKLSINDILKIRFHNLKSRSGFNVNFLKSQCDDELSQRAHEFGSDEIAHFLALLPTSIKKETVNLYNRVIDPFIDKYEYAYRFIQSHLVDERNATKIVNRWLATNEAPLVDNDYLRSFLVKELQAADKERLYYIADTLRKKESSFLVNVLVRADVPEEFIVPALRQNVNTVREVNVPLTYQHFSQLTAVQLLDAMENLKYRGCKIMMTRDQLRNMLFPLITNAEYSPRVAEVLNSYKEIGHG